MYDERLSNSVKLIGVNEILAGRLFLTYSKTTGFHHDNLSYWNIGRK
jgi:hypothetical protein